MRKELRRPRRSSYFANSTSGSVTGVPSLHFPMNRCSGVSSEGDVAIAVIKGCVEECIEPFPVSEIIETVRGIARQRARAAAFPIVAAQRFPRIVGAIERERREMIRRKRRLSASIAAQANQIFVLVLQTNAGTASRSKCARLPYHFVDLAFEGFAGTGVDGLFRVDVFTTVARLTDGAGCTFCSGKSDGSSRYLSKSD